MRLGVGGDTGRAGAGKPGERLGSGWGGGAVEGPRSGMGRRGGRAAGPYSPVPGPGHSPGPYNGCQLLLAIRAKVSTRIRCSSNQGYLMRFESN